uniref:Immunoglobulin like and fibronectin type III domain containing 1, tandem duplicate 2 n=1 Tax=Nothobranchius furzeri TaxID=105023 RepID=A0A8C6NLT6_NOTFU
LAVIRRRSKTPGVMITQSIVNLPEGKSTPDFQCKPVAVTVQEGKPVVFKAVVTGSPKPDVTWKRAKGNLSDKEKFLRKCKESTGEYILEIRNVTAAEADTYKCCAVNEYGKAVCSTTLNVVDGSTNPEDFRKLLKKSKLEKADGENDERFWDAMLNADRKDYERICSEYDVSDLHLILKKLEDKRKARGQKYEVGKLKALQQDAVFSASSDVALKMNIDEDDCCDDDSEKSGIRRSGRTNAVRINNVLQNDSGLHMADVGEINLHNKQLKEAGPKEDLLPTEFKQKDHALFECVLTHPLSTITWMKKGIVLEDGEKYNITVSGEKLIHRLLIKDCNKMDKGIYSAIAGITSCSAWLVVEGNLLYPSVFWFDPEDLNIFIKPLAVKVGHHAIFKLQFVGYKPIKIQWYRDGEELQEDNNIKIEKSAGHSRLLLIRCQRRDTGEIKIKLKNDHGFAEAISQLIVLDKPSAPLGPAEVMESSATCIELKWRPPKDDGGSPVISYILERQQVGRNTWKKIGEIPGVPSYRDTDVDRGRKYCYRIRAVTSEGTKGLMAPVLAPPKVVGSLSDCITLSWAPPTKTGGSRILGYILEKRKKGSNLWTVANASDELVTEKRCAVRDVVEGIEYEFRVCAINLSGAGEFSNPSEFVFARDPKKPPGKVMGLKVTETSHTNMILTWTKPEEKPGEQDEAKGYFVEIRQADCLEWSRCNSSPVIMTSFNVKGLKSMGMYWVRVIAMNDGGESAPEELPRYVLAVPLPVRPRFTNTKMKSFMVVRAGNSVRVTVNFEASPRPETTWLKDNVPVTKRATVSNSDGSSQLLIPSSERSDSGIYSVLLKNFAGQETFSTEVRVTDDPKPPGPVELEENVPGTVTVIWTPSPDEKLDDHLHYTVLKLDSNKHTWTTVADRLFNNKFTVCNILQGREYHFRVYAKNDMGTSAPSESPTWGKEKKKTTCKACDLRCAPTFIVPLKLQTATVGYECHMSCAVKGNPVPRVTWYRNHVSLNTDTNYYISNTCGVCSLLILRVGPKDTGEYSVVAENSLGRAECTTVISVRGERVTNCNLVEH